MTDKMTGDQLAKRFLDLSVDRAFSDVNVGEIPHSMTIDDLAKKVLQKSVESAIPDIDIAAENLEGGIKIEGFSITLDKIHLYARGRQITVTIFLLVLLVAAYYLVSI